ncbi:hypothetical protein [Saccharibacillus kuerlensis]|nr:hypothetical protein [Saccharibacillus kuerlensis]
MPDRCSWQMQLTEMHYRHHLLQETRLIAWLDSEHQGVSSNTL